MINKIWAFFIILGIIFALFTGNIEGINKEILTSSKTAFDMVISLFPVMALWLGIMKIASTSGLLEKFSKLISPLLSKLFPEIPKNHESLNYISSNIIANMFGFKEAKLFEIEEYKKENINIKLVQCIIYHPLSLFWI